MWVQEVAVGAYACIPSRLGMHVLPLDCACMHVQLPAIWHACFRCMYSGPGWYPCVLDSDQHTCGWQGAGCTLHAAGRVQGHTKKAGFKWNLHTGSELTM